MTALLVAALVAASGPADAGLPADAPVQVAKPDDDGAAALAAQRAALIEQRPGVGGRAVVVGVGFAVAIVGALAAAALLSLPGPSSCGSSQVPCCLGGCYDFRIFAVFPAALALGGLIAAVVGLESLAKTQPQRDAIDARLAGLGEPPNADPPPSADAPSRIAPGGP